MRLRLYTYWRSSSAWRVRIALHLKGLDYEPVPVHLVRDGGEQHREPFVALSPMRQVPVLQWEEGGRLRTLTQSLAIVRWLEARFPEPALEPEDPWLRARAWELAEIVNAGIQPLQNLAVLQRLEALGAERRAWAAFWIERGLEAFEARCREVAGRFSVGGRPSVADVCLVPQLYNARRFGVPLGRFERLLAIERACAALPAFQAAHPDRQPDRPKEHKPTQHNIASSTPHASAPSRLASQQAEQGATCGGAEPNPPR